MVGISQEEISQWTEAYKDDIHFSKVIAALKTEKNWANPRYPQYHYSDAGLLYFEDWQGNNRLCVPESLRNSVLDEVHNSITEAAHSGYHKTYNRLAAVYYWPRMSRHIKKYTMTCDICQKSKPRRHAPIGLLQPIPIPSRPFEVITIDFIPELPDSNGFDNVLVVVDKLTKFGIFIRCTTGITEEETAALLFKHVFSIWGLPQQIISDRDTRWRNSFWKEVCRLMGIKRSLTTAYHPQADGQTEILNQGLEIALRAYVGPSRNDWDTHLEGLALSYNTTPHTSTGFAPAYLLFGYMPITSSQLMTDSRAIARPNPTELDGGHMEEKSSITSSPSETSSSDGLDPHISVSDVRQISPNLDGTHNDGPTTFVAVAGPTTRKKRSLS